MGIELKVSVPTLRVRTVTVLEAGLMGLSLRSVT